MPAFAGMSGGEIDPYSSKKIAGQEPGDLHQKYKESVSATRPS
jgi:hypothetical protein